MNGTGDGTATTAATPSMIVGGWEYVWGAYGLTLMVVIGYVLLTEMGYRRAVRIQKMEDA